jgi:hypothetical protein
MTLENLITTFIGTAEKQERQRKKKLGNQRRILTHMASIYDKQSQPDWIKIITEIRDAGIESVSLSIALGKSKSWADIYCRNKTAKMEYKVGNALIKIHKEYVK